MNLDKLAVCAELRETLTRFEKAMEENINLPLIMSLQKRVDDLIKILDGIQS